MVGVGADMITLDWRYLDLHLSSLAVSLSKAKKKKKYHTSEKCLNKSITVKSFNF